MRDPALFISVVEPTMFILYCLTSHIYYFGLEFYNKTIAEFSFCFFPLEMYNKTIIGFDFCDMQNYQCLGESYYLGLPRH